MKQINPKKSTSQQSHLDSKLSYYITTHNIKKLTSETSTNQTSTYLSSHTHTYKHTTDAFQKTNSEISGNNKKTMEITSLNEI